MHVTAPERLNQCDPEATTELLAILDTGTSPTIGWWKRRIHVDEPDDSDSPGVPS